VAPVLSTPDTHVFEAASPSTAPRSTLTDEELDTTYEIARTIREIRQAGWQRVALQFPDHLLPDAPRVYSRLQAGLKNTPSTSQPSLGQGVAELQLESNATPNETEISPQPLQQGLSLSILGDTSYGACCVDEVAAQHASADAVVHYGRACLSPTSHLPAIYVFTINPLPLDPLLRSFKATYPDKSAKIVLTSDVTYAAHLPSIRASLQEADYTNIFTTEIQHEPTSPIPNRTVPTDDATDLATWALFHIGQPPQALLLTLASRLASIHIYPNTSTPSASTPSPPATLLATTHLALRRRYALVTRLSRASIIGILINTLSVASYLNALGALQERIRAAGKKYYVFVVGKLNAAKVANFAEVDGWVVLGCWESSLVESGEFEKPVVVPWELELALKGDETRVWTGEWRGDFSTVLEGGADGEDSQEGENGVDGAAGGSDAGDDDDDESESEPPEFDLRTGRYVQHSKPMKQKASKLGASKEGTSKEGGAANQTEHALVKRAKGDLARIGGQASPGAQYLREKRTWQGLGSDFEIAYEEDASRPVIQEGRSGIARGYQNEQDKA
jgi:diphthamide biosynthesis protein 2